MKVLLELAMENHDNLEATVILYGADKLPDGSYLKRECGRDSGL